MGWKGRIRLEQRGSVTCGQEVWKNPYHSIGREKLLRSCICHASVEDVWETPYRKIFLQPEALLSFCRCFFQGATVEPSRQVSTTQLLTPSPQWNREENQKKSKNRGLRWRPFDRTGKKKKKGILIIHKTRDAQHSSHHQLPDAQADPKQNYCPPHSPANSLSFTVQQDIIWPVWASCPGSVPSQLLESPQAPSLAGHYEKLEKSLT